jgi:hypothetical protein
MGSRSLTNWIPPLHDIIAQKDAICVYIPPHENLEAYKMGSTVFSVGSLRETAATVHLHHSCNPVLEKLALELQVKHLTSVESWAVILKIERHYVTFLALRGETG